MSDNRPYSKARAPRRRGRHPPPSIAEEEDYDRLDLVALKADPDSQISAYGPIDASFTPDSVPVSDPNYRFWVDSSTDHAAASQGSFSPSQQATHGRRR